MNVEAKRRLANNGPATSATPATGRAAGRATRRSAGRPVMDAEAAYTWAYRDQQVHRWEGAPVGYFDPAVVGGEWRGGCADGVAAMMRIAELGYRIDEGCMVGALLGGDPGRWCHRDAVAINAAVWEIGLGDCEARLAVFHHALTGERPAWGWAPEVAAQAVDGRWHRLGQALPRPQDRA